MDEETADSPVVEPGMQYEPDGPPVEAEGASDSVPPAKGGGIADLGKGKERQLALAALVVGIVALLVGTAGLIEARRAITQKHPKSSTTTTTSGGASGQISVPKLDGNTGTVASVKLANAKLKEDIIRQKSASVAKGNVISQDPAAGAKVPEGTTIKVTVSDGP